MPLCVWVEEDRSFDPTLQIWMNVSRFIVSGGKNLGRTNFQVACLGRSPLIYNAFGGHRESFKANC